MPELKTSPTFLFPQRFFNFLQCILQGEVKRCYLTAEKINNRQGSFGRRVDNERVAFFEICNCSLRDKVVCLTYNPQLDAERYLCGNVPGHFFVINKKDFT
jgi:hypothetical protein